MNTESFYNSDGVLKSSFIDLAIHQLQFEVHGDTTTNLSPYNQDSRDYIVNEAQLGNFTPLAIHAHFRSEGIITHYNQGIINFWKAIETLCFESLDSDFPPQFSQN